MEIYPAGRVGSDASRSCMSPSIQHVYVHLTRIGDQDRAKETYRKMSIWVSSPMSGLGPVLRALDRQSHYTS